MKDKVLKEMVNTYSGNSSSSEKKGKEYWDSWTKNAHTRLEAYPDDYILKSLYNVVDVAVKDCQYSLPCGEAFEEVKRVVKFRVRLSKEEIRQMFGIEVYGIYGAGIYTEMEGVICSAFSRDISGYDDFHKKGFYSVDYSFIPEDILKDLEIRLTIPAMSGLFIPKKSNFVNWIGSTRCLEYFDIT